MSITPQRSTDTTSSLRPVRRPGPDDPDEVLAAAAADGDQRALELVLLRHFDRIHSVVRRIVRNPADADDARQDALVAVARGIGSFDGRARFTTWLHRVATNAALMHLRRHRRDPEPVEELPGIATGSSPEWVAMTRVDVDAALDRLAPEYRQAVLLADVAELEYTEIARRLGVPIGTVRSRIARGRSKLAELLV